MKTPFLFVSLCLALAMGSCQKEQHLYSPDRQVKIAFYLVGGRPFYDVVYEGIPVINHGRLGITLDQKPYDNFLIDHTASSSYKNTWQPVWGKTSKVINHFNEWHINLKEAEAPHRVLNLIIRAYNDGMAVRYVIPAGSGNIDFTISEDLTQFNFTKDHTWWSANGERENLGPLPLDSLPGKILTPMVIKCDSTHYAAIHEAAIYNFAKITLTPGDSAFSLKCNMAPSHGKAGMKTSWRVLMLGRHPGDLIESDLLVNLNPPCKIRDTEWIKPGKSMWDWRVWGYVAPDGFEYGLNTVSHKRFVDFAASHNIQYMLLDADWYGPEFNEESDPTSARKGIDIDTFMKYARDKKVKVILYLNDVGAKRYGLETVLSKFHDWGAAGVKYGFMTDKGQKKVRNTRKIVEMCAKYHLIVDFHDMPIPPSGDRRTWPNLLTREYCHSQADAKRSYYPETAVSSAFINMIAGPLDMCNGWYGLNDADKRVKVFEPIPGTVVAETAKLVVFYSGLTVLPDAPEEYMKKADLFTFVENLPDSYDEMRVLDGNIDRFITVARRSGKVWHVGSLTNRKGITLKIPLTFLEPDKTYRAFIGEDAVDTHYLHNREAYKIRTLEVHAGSVITARLAPGGGFVMRLEPAG